MGYSSTEVIKRFIKSDGTQCQSIQDVFTYLRSRPDRLPLGTTFNSKPIVDIIAIGIDTNWIRSGKIDPVVMSLNVSTFLSIADSADRDDRIDRIDTIGNKSYFSGAQPVYMNYLNSLKLPAIRIKSDEAAKLNPYINDSRNNAFCGARADSSKTYKPKDVDYWNDAESYLSNYAKNADAMNNVGVMEINYLFHTIDLIDQLQMRFGYRMVDPSLYDNSLNWLNLSANGISDVGSRYLRLMYLTEDDLMLHAGIMDITSRKLFSDNSFCKSDTFSKIADCLYDQTKDIGDINSGRYFIANYIPKNGPPLIAGHWIYSRDFRYKAHLTQGGHLISVKFPLTADDPIGASSMILKSSTWYPNPDNFITCFLLCENNGNVVVYAKPGTTMQTDGGYWGIIAGFKWGPTPSFSDDNARNGAITIIGRFLQANNTTAPLQGLSDLALFKILITRTPRDALVATFYAYDHNKTSLEDVIESIYSNGSTIAVAQTGTSLNAFVAMSDYKVIVNSGGAVMAINAGPSADPTSMKMVSGTFTTNWKYVADSGDSQCIHGWKFIKQDGSPVSDGNPIMDITTLNDTKGWCYVNPFAMVSDVSNSNYIFVATNMQQILWHIGPYVDMVDYMYQMSNASKFWNTMRNAGYTGAGGTMSDAAKSIQLGYCAKGTRWGTDINCRHMLYDNLLPDATKRVIAYDIPNRVCKISSMKTNSLCNISSISNLTDIEKSLIALDPAFIHAVYAYSTTGYLAKIGVDRYTTINNAITVNMANLSEAQILYLRKFYEPVPSSSVLVDNNMIIYAEHNMIMSGLDYPDRSFGVVSPNNLYQIIFTNGVLASAKNDSDPKIINLVWNNQTADMAAASDVLATVSNMGAILSLTTDGNIVIYSDLTKSKVVWTTGLAASSGPTNLIVDNLGNLVLYQFNEAIGIWSLRWASIGTAKYTSKSNIWCCPIIKPLSQPSWQAAYRANLALSVLPARYDAMYLRKKYYQASIIAYIDAYGSLRLANVPFDTNSLSAMGISLVAKQYLYAPSDKIWKYMKCYVDMYFPDQLVALTHAHVLSKVSDVELNALLSSAVYEQQVWQMLIGLSTGNIIVYRFTSDDAMIKFMRAQGKTMTDAQYSEGCYSNPNSCVAELSQVLSDPNIDLTSATYNTLCDLTNVVDLVPIMKKDGNYNKVLSSYTLETGFGGNRNTAIVIIGKAMQAKGLTYPVSLQAVDDVALYQMLTGSAHPMAMLNGKFVVPGMYSTATSSAVKQLCLNAYGAQTCSAASTRYKSAFAGRKETYSGNCVDICNSSTTSDDVKASCKTGSIAYCNQSDNIFGQTCTTDMSKYPELADIKAGWCASNPNDLNYNAHCNSTTAKVAQQVLGTLSSAITGSTSAPQFDSRGYTKDTSGSSNVSKSETNVLPDWAIYLIIVTIAFVLGAILVFGWKRYRKYKSTVGVLSKPKPKLTRQNAFTQPSIQTIDPMMPIMTQPMSMSVDPLAIPYAAPIDSSLNGYMAAPM